MNILIVDDEKILVKGLKKSLEKEGYTIFTAYAGNEALEQFNTREIDFILLDLMLPEIDGMTLCKKIRETSKEILINLIDNSIKYGKENGYTKVEAIVENNRKIIRISDNGIGISTEDLPFIFDNFYTADKSRSFE